ncbi:helix-turn-helix transcriptional regulator [Rhodococcus sp. O3]|uniref:helix-turn-helix transcriptional regulator n=1 Tax=Rhodococcus sp. O3 TaxID=3404919 RepID=UPI003B67CA6B
MAAAEFLSINTVKSQMRTLCRKLGVHSRKDAIAAACRLALDDSTGAHIRDPGSLGRRRLEDDTAPRTWKFRGAGSVAAEGCDQTRESLPVKVWALAPRTMRAASEVFMGLLRMAAPAHRIVFGHGDDCRRRHA